MAGARTAAGNEDLRGRARGPFRRGARRRAGGLGRRLLVYGFLAYMGLILLLQEINGWRVTRELEDLRARVRAAHAENAALRRKLTMLKSDAYVERVAREELGLTRPDEVPFLPGDGAPAP